MKRTIFLLSFSFAFLTACQHNASKENPKKENGKRADAAPDCCTGGMPSRFENTSAASETSSLEIADSLKKLYPFLEDMVFIRGGEFDMGARDAIYLLENLGLNTAINGRGTVHSQDPPPGTILRKGDRVTLQMSITEG